MSLSEQDRALIKDALISVGHRPQGAADIAADPSEYAMDDEDLAAVFAAIRAEATTTQAQRIAKLEAALRDAKSHDNLHYRQRIPGQNDHYCDVVDRINALLSPPPQDKEGAG